MKSIIKRIVEKAGYEIMSLRRFSTELTEVKSVKNLMRRLAPVATNKDLIRLGPCGDGGYLIPDDLDGIAACFSPGVDKLSGFERECADRKMRVFLADKSVESPAESHELFHFTQKFVGAFNTEIFMTLDDWITESLPGENLEILLQMDIENFEYEALLAASHRLMQRTRILVVEFHSLDQLWNKPFFGLASRVFEKILNTHTCVHIHPNNCYDLCKRDGLEIPPITEFTFLRTDRVIKQDYDLKFPHLLDSDTTDRPHIALPSCWQNAER